ncbi:hypothetical protein [Methanobrevibacter sp. V74]|nr:hypothetical protein [Methanobrevibacter sp. V74]
MNYSKHNAHSLQDKIINSIIDEVEIKEWLEYYEIHGRLKAFLET